MKKATGIAKIVTFLSLLLGDSALPMEASIIRMFPFGIYPQNNPTLNQLLPPINQLIPPVPSYKPFTITPLIIPPRPVYSPIPVNIPRYAPPTDYSAGNNPTPQPTPTPLIAEQKKAIRDGINQFFSAIFGRNPFSYEYQYWYSRYMNDYLSTADLFDKMLYYKSFELTMPENKIPRGSVDQIPNNNVPLVVEQEFSKVFGRKPTHVESVYWKGRARNDKGSITPLNGAMQFHKAKGLTMPRT